MNQSSSGAERPGLRERKKAKTRAAIQEHALRLFRDQGYAATTVEQIADAAEVSPSTFFRYFGTKEEVALYDPLDPLLVEAFRAQPPELTVLEALRRAVHVVFGSLGPIETDEQLERGRLVAREPTLQAAYAFDLIRSGKLMLEIIAERTGRPVDDLELRAFVGALMGVMVATMLPLLTGESTDLVGDIDRVFGYLEKGIRL